MDVLKRSAFFAHPFFKNIRYSRASIGESYQENTKALKAKAQRAPKAREEGETDEWLEKV